MGGVAVWRVLLRSGAIVTASAVLVTGGLAAEPLTAAPASAMVPGAEPPAPPSAVPTSPVTVPSLPTEPVPPPPPVVSPVDARIAQALTARATVKAFGTRFSGQVVDVGSGAVVWGAKPGWALRPASTTKLVTAADALTVFGPTHRFTTSVRRGATWRDVVLVGGGDPSLSSAHLAALARRTASTLHARDLRRVRLWFDDSLFPAPSLATGWKRSYVPRDVRAVRALVVDERHAADTSRDAANLFARRLHAAGVSVASVGRQRAAADAPVTATVRGEPVGSIVTRMLLRSDNDHAEALHRLVAIGVQQRPTWAGSAAASRQLLAEQGLLLPTTALYDGSGLSRSARLSAAQLVALVTRMFDPTQAALTPLTASLPVAGVSGTLRASFGRYTRAPSACAKGLVHAKTGTLGDVVSLAGYTTGADGRVKAFAFVVNGMGDSLALKQRVDNLAATVTGCY